MPGVRLILALHNHQPVGCLDGVFEASFRDSYLPFLEVMEDYPDIPFVLHISGPVLEWLIDNQPKYVARVRALAESGRVEILGGGFFEPILTGDPMAEIGSGKIERMLGVAWKKQTRCQAARGLDRRASLGAASGLGPRRGGDSSTPSSTTSTSSALGISRRKRTSRPAS